MRIQIVFCGFSEAALISARKIGGDLLYIIHSREEKSKLIKDKIEKEFGGICYEVDAYDIQKNYEILHKIYSEYCRRVKSEDSVELIVNVTGASKFGLIAAFAFAQFIHLTEKANAKKKHHEDYIISREDLEKMKIEFVYLEESTQKITEIPFIFYFQINEMYMKFGDFQKIVFRGKKPTLQREILKIFKNRERIELLELERLLNKDKSTITHALKNFLKAKVITQIKEGVKVVYIVNKKAVELISTLEDIYRLEKKEKSNNQKTKDF